MCIFLISKLGLQHFLLAITMRFVGKQELSLLSLQYTMSTPPTDPQNKQNHDLLLLFGRSSGVQQINILRLPVRLSITLQCTHFYRMNRST